MCVIRDALRLASVCWAGLVKLQLLCSDMARIDEVGEVVEMFERGSPCIRTPVRRRE